MNSFPTQLFETFSGDSGAVESRPVFDATGNPVRCREALRLRDEMIEHLGSLQAVQGALDQIIQRFGTDVVPEVTGRSRRIVRKGDCLCVENRPAAVNLQEAQAFMDDKKRILVFSDAGGTGRSYHADLRAINQHLRVHYLLEPGWKADAAIQGLGRTNRTNQAQPPLFRPISTNVKAEKRFLSTIARRLDTLGAITKGQRETGGQGLFRPTDNLESIYARSALRQLYVLLYTGKVAGCSFQQFEAATGLQLTDKDGSLREELPPITTFLNRLLALTIALQNTIFDVFEGLLLAKTEAAIAAGTYDRGLETLIADSLTIAASRVIYRHPKSGAETLAHSIIQRTKTHPLQLGDALARAKQPGAVLMINTTSNRAAVRVHAPSITLDDGEVEPRARLIRPMDAHAMPLQMLEHTHWADATDAQFAAAWLAELATVPATAEETIHLVTGLLLPLWKTLPTHSARVYRLQTDDGQRLIGRLVYQEWIDQFTDIKTDTGTLASVWPRLMAGEIVAHLQNGIELRRVKILGQHRIELTGHTLAMLERLKTTGVFTEMIAWKVRVFVPTAAPQTIEDLAALYPLMRTAGRDTAAA